MASETMICAICGATNDANLERCTSCGARLEALGSADLTDEEARARRHQQETFEWKWVFVAFAIYMVLQGLILVAMPLVIDTFDPQGLAGLGISAGVWFLGGILVGVISPGKTFVEPAVAAFLAVIPTILWIDHISDVHELSLMAALVGGMIGVMITLLGAFVGEKIQMSMGR